MSGTGKVAGLPELTASAFGCTAGPAHDWELEGELDLDGLVTETIGHDDVGSDLGSIHRGDTIRSVKSLA